MAKSLDSLEMLVGGFCGSRARVGRSVWLREYKELARLSCE